MSEPRREAGALTKEDCLSLLEGQGTPAHVIRHCRKVSEVAVRLGRALNRAGLLLDIDLIRRAGLLHDIARGAEGDHAREGAAIVGAYDTAAAAIIADHMTHNYPDKIEALTESDLVSLADRSVREDVYVGFRPRMEEILARHQRNPEAVRVFQEKIRETESFIGEIEVLTGRLIDDIASAGAVPILPLLKRVERPGRYIGGELNVADKEPETVATRFCFAFPDLYEIGMSYTGLQIIYGLLNEMDEVFCERAFAPAPDMEALLREQGLPLFALETHTSLKSFDLLGFTLQYEHSFTNIVNMLNLADIPVRSDLRDESAPILLAGGPCAYNPEPLAEVFDLFCIGDGEELLPELCRLHGRWKETGGSKEAFLMEAAALEGVYVPAFYTPIYAQGVFVSFEKKYDFLPNRIKKRVVKNLEEAYFPSSPVVPLIETVHDRAVAEIFRGCGRGCRFCQAGFVYRPVRRRSEEKIFELIDGQLCYTGYDEVSLLSLSTGDYPGIERLIVTLMDDLKEREVSLSLPSLRLDSVSGEALRRIGDYKKSSLTFAPEAGTQRLRDVVRKNITEQDILSGVEKAIEIGWNRVKFYFMVGLPTETTADLDGIAELAERVMRRARQLQSKGNRNFNLTVSVSNFVPKPHTPFQWVQGDSEVVLIEKNRYLKERFRSVKGVSFKFHDTRSSAVEMMLAKGDRRTLAAILAAVQNGCKFDSWREHFSYAGWQAAFEAAGLSMTDSRYTNPAAPLPWEIIDAGVDGAFLRQEYDRALSGHNLAATQELPASEGDVTACGGVEEAGKSGQ